MMASKRLRKHNDIAVDRISNLPESVLLYILSFLPAVYAVRTCLLSRRWQNLWTSVPCLDFGFDSSYAEFWYSESSVKFINRFLLQYKGSSIHTFKLASVVADSCDAELWMRWAINRKVKVLDIVFPRLSLYLPQTSFGSKNLVALKLYGEQLSMTAPPTSCFPCLKTLELHSSWFSDGKFENALISCCVMLENLSIRVTQYSEVETLRVHAQQLKHLVIHLNEVSRTGCVIDVDGPALEDLDISVRGPCSLSLQNVGYLSRAMIDLSSSTACQSLINCFSALYSVKSLCLSSIHRKKACVLEPAAWPMVHNVNLTRLTLGARSVWAQLLPCFFYCFPNLQVLRLEEEFIGGSGHPGFYHGLLSDGSPFPLRLRKFVSEEFRATRDELSTLKYILKNGEVLDRVRIHYSCSGGDEDYEEKYRVAQKILGFPRASKTCRIRFS